ncbi:MULTISPECIES: tetraacyldisaccharide 4'-kinase [unclassified Campylobacter]|uniref:tetraacyldisaccharide 4'-kinase n=1 Tax=unclassified Campylobacter TaxID=2593542 RepID=UPI0022E9D33D|nr:MULTISPECIES: tetraacyldisaccharide 4'-kinase [unclassified Campylobacter]MDA3073265.1 tetraacyldisaccharide 4'-kinase [Campylobacter sp. JMF_10 EL2]
MFKIWLEKNLYDPGVIWLIISFFLLPLSIIFGFIQMIRRALIKPKDYGIAVVSVGNLTLGGSGKTPLVGAIFTEFSPEIPTCIILRGYGRKSHGLQYVAKNGEILCDIKTSGDEAMLYAKTLKNASVLVSENRENAIMQAKKDGFALVILDDGFSKFHIEKFEIVLRPSDSPLLPLPLPVAGYRYPPNFYKFADFIPSLDDIKSTSEISNFPNPHTDKENTILISAIAKPWRLKEFEKHAKASFYFPDHYDFTKDEIQNLLHKSSATHIICTAKDFVKLENFGLNISVIELKTTLSENFKNQIKAYITSKLNH